jgi:hypothetical protein
MNWHIDNDGTVTVDLAEGEKGKPSKAKVDRAKATVSELRKSVKGTTHAEVHAHETTTGRGFRAEHITVTVSNVDPKA